MLVSVGTKTRGPGCCEVLGAGMIALLLCSVMIVSNVAEDDSLDVCFVKPVMGERRNAEEGG